LSDVSFESVMVLEEASGMEVLFTLYALPSSPPSTQGEGSCSYGFHVSSTPEGCNDWKQNCQGQISMSLVGEEGYKPDVSSDEHQLTTTTTAEDIYKRLGRFGLTYGPSFRTLVGDIHWGSTTQDQTRHSGTCLLQHPTEEEPLYPIHPCSLDSGLQLNLAILSIADGETWYGRIPVSVDKLSIRHTQKKEKKECESCVIEGWGRNDGLQGGVGGLRMYCDEVEVECQGLRMVRTETAFSDT